MLLAGSLWRGEGFEEGWADVEGGRVRAVGRGTPPRTPDHRGVVVPAPVNAHTHLGDRALRGRMDPALGLDALVRHPDGLKHRLLAQTPPAVLQEGMRMAVAELAASGCRLAVDFREGGVAGVRALREAAAGGPPVTILGRAGAGETPDQVLQTADGLGIPAISNLPTGEAARWAQAAGSAGKPVALHASEGAREPIDPVLDLRPHHVVHMTRGTPSDFAALAQAGVPVVVCPRSNAALVHHLPPVAAMQAAGCRVALGTDNAAFQTASVWEEAAFLVREGKLPPAAALQALFARWEGAGKIEEGGAGPLLVLRPAENPSATVLSGGPAIAARLP